MHINERVIVAASYIIEKECTIRQAASHLKYGKSTLHTDVTVRLPKLDLILYRKVRKILNYNYQQKHIRGGESTRKKHLNKEQ